ncbi:MULTISPECIES: hypothetical protein [unclassified Rhodococcus (in: high G+C Gram-positive bacteria)]|uniref:hypothetical protein n=1 Tax=unclassified Rhodococcus (in: high G+C Gram-positive bacteria) TaxID=192944 RepID=UPI001639B762|nr:MULTISPECIES: hypothetical protein [unclassified Rhodococcus (in: high G+C Gram-positive bacteria)]MBC2639890.1 hypothetical protein [Rhodococcus sp. 3A]MBC2895363.1 hypothetical protein [Rhodococcus sp. 4CII]
MTVTHDAAHTRSLSVRPARRGLFMRYGGSAGEHRAAFTPVVGFDHEDEFVLNFGIRWIDFGGAGVEDIFVAFGWTEARYFERLECVAARRFAPIENTIRRQLLDLCADRLRQLDSAGAHTRREATTMMGKLDQRHQVASDLTEIDLIRVVEALTGTRPQPIARDTPARSEPTDRSD